MFRYKCMQEKYFTKYTYVCLGSKIPWICMYIEKILYVCSKIPHGKKREQKESEQEKIENNNNKKLSS